MKGVVETIKNSPICLLKLLWSKCKFGLFFETGLTELPSEYKLQDWTDKDLINYININLNPTSIIEIGRFHSFDQNTFYSKSQKFDGDFKRAIFFLKK